MLNVFGYNSSHWDVRHVHVRDFVPYMPIYGTSTRELLFIHVFGVEMVKSKRVSERNTFWGPFMRMGIDERLPF